MIDISPKAWRTMTAHALNAYPSECCGVMLGTSDGGSRTASLAVPLPNVYAGSQADRYEIRPEDLLACERRARESGMEIVGIFHSHPDHDAYFSQTDLKNSCPWYSFVVISVRDGRVAGAASFTPNADQTEAPAEELRIPDIAVAER